MKRFSAWLPVILWAGIIFYLSSIPSLQSGLACDFILRKIAHVAEYFVLTFLLHRALKKTFKFHGLTLSLILAGAVFLYAVSDEMHQFFVPGRHGTFQDVLIDQLGVLVFLAGSQILRRVPAFRGLFHPRQPNKPVPSGSFLRTQ